MRVKNHIAIIDPAVKRPELECFNHLVELAPIPLTYHLPALWGISSLRALEEGPGGIVILGSASSVLERTPWQLELENWLWPKIEQKTPTLALCYGHQMVAHRYGARVEFVSSDQKKISGFRKVQLHPNRLWGNQALSGSLVVSHREAVMGCPKGMEITTSSPEIPIDGLSHKSLPLWSFQSHPEATPAFLRSQGISEPISSEAFEFGYSILRHFFGFVVTNLSRV